MRGALSVVLPLLLLSHLSRGHPALISRKVVPACICDRMYTFVTTAVLNAFAPGVSCC
jgi:hypothetical protein